MNDPGGQIEHELINGVLVWLAIAVGVALMSRLAHAFTDYVFQNLLVEEIY